MHARVYFLRQLGVWPTFLPIVYLLLLGQPTRGFCQLLVRPDGYRGPLEFVTKIRDETWIVGNDDVYRYDPRSNRATPLGIGRVDQVALLNDEVWYSNSGGVFRYDPVHGSRQVYDRRQVSGDTDLRAISFVNGDVWFAIDYHGVFRYDRKNDRAFPIEGSPSGMVYDFYPVNQEVWFYGDEGTFRYDSAHQRAVPVTDSETGTVFRSSLIPGVNDAVLLATKNGAFLYEFRQKRAIQLAEPTGAVSEIVPVGHELWIAGTAGAFRYDVQGKRAIPVEGSPPGITHINFFNGEIWFNVNYRVFRYDAQRKRSVEVELPSPVLRQTPIAYVDGEVWFISNLTLYRYDRAHNVAIDVKRLEDDNVFFDDAIWLNTEKGLSRYDPAGRVALEPMAPISWITGVFGPRFALSGIGTLSVHYSTPFKPDVRKTTVFLSTSTRGLAEKEPDQAWQPISTALYELNPPTSAIHVSFRDEWGNEAKDIPFTFWVIPTWQFATVAIVAVALTAWMVCLLLSPYVRFCHLVLMNPYLRKYSSFWIVPVLLTIVPALRHHLLRRYRKRMITDGEPRPPKLPDPDEAEVHITLGKVTHGLAPLSLGVAAAGYSVPSSDFEATAFLRTLSKCRVVVIHGQSGIGKTAFLRYLAFTCLTSAVKPIRIPILIDLSLYKDVEPKEAVAAELEKYGDLTDQDLTKAFLDQGGFLLLFDGVNEVNDDSMRAIARFVDIGRTRNSSCITTQIVTPELSKIGTSIEAQHLSVEHIQKLIRQQISQPNELIDRLTDGIYELCKLPLQLELVIEMWTNLRWIPDSQDQLFQKALDPVLNQSRWEASGHGDYPDRVCEAAYKMLIERRPYDPESREIPKAMEEQLIVSKLLNQQGSLMEFRHDKIRAYLAFRYFNKHWRHILVNPQATIDSNWDSMLQFFLLQYSDSDYDQGSANAKVLLFWLLDQDLESGKRLFNWLQANRPGLSRDWTDPFIRAVGERELGLGGLE